MLTQLVAGSVIVVAGGCSSDDDEADGADVTSPAADTSGQVDTTVETTAPVTAPVTQPAPTSAPTITSPGPPIIEIELLGSPDYIVADDHGVWVRGEPAPMCCSPRSIVPQPP
jgi:hypothetical protein